MEKAISLYEITKVFGNRKVLDNITLDVKKGEIFGLLGPSGAGKTTLIKILTGQLKAESGSSVINGLDSRKLTGKDYRGFGIMMDDFGVYERLSCFDNLKIFARIYGIGNDKIHGALEAVGLADAKKTPAANLSKGMRSRLRLARVFMIEPEVLFLDEPTSSRRSWRCRCTSSMANRRWNCCTTIRICSWTWKHPSVRWTALLLNWVYRPMTLAGWRPVSSLNCAIT